MKTYNYKKIGMVSGRAVVAFEDGGQACIMEVSRPAAKMYIKLISFDEKSVHLDWLKHSDGKHFRITIEELVREPK